MSANSSAEPVLRPKSIHYAVYLIGARILLMLVTIPISYAVRDDLTRRGRKSNPSWSDETLHHNVTAALQNNFIQSVFVAVAIAGVGWAIWVRKRWSRWAYLILCVVPSTDILKVEAFFVDSAGPLKVALGLLGVATLASLVFLYIAPSNVYYRFSDAAPGWGPFKSLMAPRPSTADSGVTDETTDAADGGGAAVDADATGTAPATQPKSAAATNPRTAPPRYRRTVKE